MNRFNFNLIEFDDNTFNVNFLIKSNFFANTIFDNNNVEIKINKIHIYYFENEI